MLAYTMALTVLSTACASVSDVPSDPFWTKEFQVGEASKLEVRTSGGNITVSSHEGNQLRVEMLVSVNGRSVDSSDAKAEKVLEDYKINISQTGNMVSAVAERRSSSGWLFGSNNASISFRVYVPQATSTHLNTSGGSITLEGVTGPQDIRTSGGNLMVKNVNGNMVAKTSGGTIRVENYQGDLEAKTSGGSIKMDNAKGKLLVATSGGSIKLNEVAGAIDAHTSGGSIQANILELNNELRLNTSGGSIDATVPAGLGLNLDLKGNRVETVLTNFDGEVEKDKIKGSINGGGIPVKLSTSGGTVNLKYQ